MKEIEMMQRYSNQIKCEGLVIKDSNSEYDASGTRSSKWVKLKN